MAPAKADTSLKVQLDFTGLSDRERSTHFTPGDVLFKIEEFVARIKSGDERKPTAQQTRFMQMKVRAIRTASGQDVGGVLYENLMTQIPGKEPQKYLWKVRNLLKAVAKEGGSVPTGAATIDFATLVGRSFMGTVIDGDPYTTTNDETGKTTEYETSQIDAFHQASLFDEAYPAGSAPAPVATKTAVQTGKAAEVAADEDDTSDAGSDEDDNSLPPLEVADL